MNYKKLIEKEFKKRNITIGKWHPAGQFSYAWVKERIVEIPIPTSISQLGTCFHEMAHIELGHTLTRKRCYIQEYEAERKAIHYLKDFGFNPKSYIEGAKMYVIYKIKRSILSGHDLKKVPKEIMKWLGKSFKKYYKTIRIKKGQLVFGS